MSATDGKTTVSAETPSVNIQQGLLDFLEWMRDTNKDKDTITERMKILNRLIEKGLNLYDYKAVFKVITNLVREKDPSKPLEGGTKQQWKQAYMQFTKFMGWAIPDRDVPRFKVNRYKISPYDLPTPHEIDCLLARANFEQRLAILIWRDTGATREEAAWIQRKDIDFERRIIAINHAVKGHDSRLIPMTSDLYATLRELPPSTDPEAYIFDPKNPYRDVVTANLYKRFWNLRKRVAKNTNNPKINQIHPHLLRHGFGVEGAEELGNPYDVKYFMGHKSMSSTDIYTRLARSKGPNDLIVEFAFTPERTRYFVKKASTTLKRASFPTDARVLCGAKRSHGEVGSLELDTYPT